MIRSACLAAALAALFVTAPALADSQKALANRSFQQGEAAFARRDFRAAALAFEKAARLAPHPSAWLNAAEAWLRAGNLVLAAADCDEVLALPDAGESSREEANRRLAWIEARTARLDLRGTPAVTVAVDGGAPSALPFSARVPPGKHTLAVTDPRDDGTSEIELDVTAGKVVVLELPRVETPGEARIERSQDEARPPEQRGEDGTSQAHAAELPGVDRPLLPLPEARLGPPPAAIVSFAASGASFVAASIFGALTLAAKNDYDGAPSQDRADRFFGRRTATDIAFACGVVAGLLGAVLWFTDKPE